MKIKVAKSTR